MPRVELGCCRRSFAPFANGTDTNNPAVLQTLETAQSVANLEDQLARAGPVSVSIDATPTDFYYYGGGVYDNKACTSYELDHSVLAVGYGVEAGTKYWIVKNSWSSYWGEEGFVRVAYDGPKGVNICGVATTPNYVMNTTLP